MSTNQSHELHTIATSPIDASAFELFDPSEAELYVNDITKHLHEPVHRTA